MPISGITGRDAGTGDGVTLGDPSVPVVSFDEMKLQLRLTEDDEAEIVESYVSAASEYLEAAIRRSFTNRTNALVMSAFPAEVVLPRPPAVSVTSIEYLDLDGASQTLDASLYQVSTVAQPGRIMPASGESWPDTADDYYDTITVTWVAGYGAAATDVPQRFRQAVRLLAAEWFKHREPLITGTISRVPDTVQALIAIDRVWT